MGQIIMLTNLDQVLAAKGIPFVEVNEHPSDYTNSSTWKERTRPPSTGCFTPSGVLCHHTASPAGTSDAADINTILWGNGSAPGPISSIYIGRSGTCYILAAGRCNHGGSGVRPGVDSGCEDMNCALIGIEVGNNGVGEVWSDACTNTYGAVVAALLEGYGFGLGDIYFHATTGPPSGGCNQKIDPAGPWQRQPDIGGATWDLETWRSFVQEFMGTTPPGEDDLMAQPCGFIQCNNGIAGHHIDGSEYRCPIDGTTFWVSPAGTIQWVHGGELDDKIAVESAAGRRVDTWNTPVSAPDNFGRLEGDKPTLG
jgi:hypothetical protein